MAEGEVVNEQPQPRGPGSEEPASQGSDVENPSVENPSVENPSVENGRSGAESPEGLSTKLDPDFVPQDIEPPEEKKAREHPEETGS
jgi:hypothetical protein